MNDASIMDSAQASSQLASYGNKKLFIKSVTSRTHLQSLWLATGHKSGTEV
jgi:hypothetical protein